MKLAFCGLGLMGEPMVKRLLAAGHTVHVWNRTPAKAQALLELGAQWCDTPAKAASGVDGVFMCLLNTQAVEQVVFGADGIVHARQLRWLVDHSSVPPNRLACGVNDSWKLVRLIGWMPLYLAAWPACSPGLWP